MTLDSIKQKIEKLLVETDGHLHPHDLAAIVEEAKSIGLDDKQIARLVPEVDRSINWDKIREEKAAAEEAKRVENEVEKLRREELEAAPQLLSGLVQSMMMRGMAKGEEIQSLLDRAEMLEQSQHALARQIKSQMDFAKWAPFPAADINARTIGELLVSTDWYAPHLYPKPVAASQTEVPVTVAPPPKPVQPQPAPRPQQRPSQPPPRPKSRGWSLFWLLPFAVAIGYYFFLKPYLRDKNAPRYYTIAEDAVLRSSAVAADETKLATLAYGTELIGYGSEGGWQSVKMNGQEGYVASRLLVEKRDFHLLNSIFGNEEAKEVIATSRARRALIQYFRDQDYLGEMSSALKQELYGTAFPMNEVWQVFCKPPESPTNSVLYPRVVKPRAKYADFAVILTKAGTGERKVLLFSFNDDGDPTLEEEQSAPRSGDLVSVSRRKGRGATRYVFQFTRENRVPGMVE